MNAPVTINNGRPVIPVSDTCVTESLEYSTKKHNGRTYYVGRSDRFPGLSKVFLQENRRADLTTDLFVPVMVDKKEVILGNVKSHNYSHPFNTKLIPVCLVTEDGNQQTGFFVGPNYKHYQTALKLVVNSLIQGDCSMCRS